MNDPFREVKVESSQGERNGNGTSRGQKSRGNWHNWRILQVPFRSFTRLTHSTRAAGGSREPALRVTDGRNVERPDGARSDGSGSSHLTPTVPSAEGLRPGPFGPE